jgi:hypothetical protein
MTQPPKSKKLSREEIALIEVGQTDIGRGTALALVAAFLLLIVAVPVIEIATQVRAARRSGATTAAALAGLPHFSLVRQPPRPTDFTFPVHRQSVAERNPLHDAEHAIEDASLPRKAVQARLQAALTGAMRAGNSKVVIGEGDWLFYRPGIDYLAGPGFLSEASRRIAPRRDPDPRPAIREFAATCAAAGIRLVLLPMSDKAMVHPEKLARGPHPPLDNPDYAAFAAGLATDGIEVWSPRELLAGLASGGEAYLRQDTHWTPPTMDAVAAALAAHLALPAPARPRAWTSAPRTVSRVGDLVDTLKLPAGQDVFAPQAVTIEPVSDEAGEPWRPSRDAEVLLLGDSFTNIYSAAPMGWGESAGLGARLALHLGRDVDVIAINGAGANGTRAELARQPQRLFGKRVVVWQFSVRDLAVSDWKRIPIAAPEAPSGGVADPAALEIVGTITVSSAVPAPGGLPYADAITTLKVKVDEVIAGAYAESEVLVVLPCMRAYTLLPGAHLREGQRVRLTLVPWATVEATQGQIKRYDDTDEFDLAQWWATGVESR